MPAPALSDLQFLYRTAFTRSNVEGVTACVHVSVYRGPNDKLYYYVPDNPFELPLVQHITRTGWL